MKIVFTAAVMDCLHEGHVNLLNRMRVEAGADGKVAVILHDDKSTFENKKRFPVQSLRQRSKNLADSGLVNKIYLTEKADPSFDMVEFIKENQENYKPAEIVLQKIGVEPETVYSPLEFVYMRGDDWQDFPGRKVIEAFNIPIKFVAYTPGVSTTQIREDLKK